MDDEKEHPLSNLAQKFIIDQLNVSNQFTNELLINVQNALIETIPDQKTKIEQVIQRFQHPFNSCSSFVDKNTKLIKLPVSVLMRNECGQEQKEGIYAVSLTENLGIGLLEECCRKIVLIPDEVCLVEARKFEAELNCFCTIPKFSQQLELIESGTKYELVFEKKSKSHSKHRNASQQKSNFNSALQLNLNTNRKSSNYQNDYANEPSHSNELSPNFETTSDFSTENELLSKLFGKDNNEFSNALPDSDLNASTSHANWANKDADSVRYLPDFDPIEIFMQDPKARSIFDYLKKNKMDSNGKIRINFVQVIGKYYLEKIKTKLDGQSTAALRRAFIDKLFTCLNKILKPLPPQEDFSNRMGKGFFDIYLKHQNTKTRRQMGQSTSYHQQSNPDKFGKILLEHLDRSARTEASNSPEHSSIKSENYDNFD